jgi:hypothetical protein
VYSTPTRREFTGWRLAIRPRVPAPKASSYYRRMRGTA